MRRRLLLLLLAVAAGLAWLATPAAERANLRGVAGSRPMATADAEAEPPPAAEREDGVRPSSLDVHDDRIAGRVIDGDGRPVAGASIAYLPSGLLWFECDGDWRAGWESVPEPTDADGRFAVERLYTSNWWIVASKPGYAPASTEATWGDETLVIELGPGATASGHVVRADGRPAAGADVNGAKTDAEGRFVVTDLAPGPCSIVAELGGERGEVAVDLRAGETRDGLLIPLEPPPRASVVPVQLLGPDGAPLAGAYLSVGAEDCVHGLHADETGRVRRAKDVPPGSDAWVEVNENEERSLVAWRRSLKTLPADTTEEIVVRCEPPLRVAVVVRDADGLVPQGLKVWLSGGYEIAADRRLGRFAFAATPDQPSMCTAWADGFVTASEEWKPKDGETLAIVLEREATVMGRIVEADGTPAAHVRVNHEAVSDEGRFRIGEPAGRITVEVQEYLSMLETTVLRLAVTLERGDVLDLGDLALPQGHVIEGSVTDPEGRPSGGVQLMAVRRETGPLSYFVTGRDGRFGMRVRGDDLRVIAWKRGTGAAIGTPGEGSLALRLAPEPRVVLRIEGEWSAVRWSTLDGFPLRVLWADQRVEALPPGPLRLEVMDGDAAVHVRELDATPGCWIEIDLR